MTGPLDPDARPLLVFSHPNHELAVWGLLQRVRPRLVFLTDGGGPAREDESRAGLARLGLLDRARFLGHGEGELYRTLVERDVERLQEIGREVRGELGRVAPTHVLCDAVELYNPVHDLTLPVVRFASSGALPCYEIPLVHERHGSAETYEVQRFPASGQRPRVRLALREAELAAKLAARDEIYSLLRAQLGPLLVEPAERFTTEEFGPAGDPLAAPAPGLALRYERRGELLRRRRQVETVITYSDHYLPVARALAAAA